MSSIFHQGRPSRLRIISSEIITVGTDVVSLSPPGDQNDTHVLGVFFEVQDAPIRWRADRQDPSVTQGHKLEDEDTAALFLPPTDLRFIRDISATADATLVVDYLGT